jgi:hypothetical protein
VAWNNAGEVPVGSTGQVYTAAVGATAPTAFDSSLAAATWTGAGFLTEDGFTKAGNVETAEIKAWQSFSPIRREVTGRNDSFSFALMQWNENNVILAFGGGAISAAGTGYKYTPPQDSDALVEKALVIDANDGSNVYRFYAPRVTIMEGVESTFKRGEAAILPVTFETLEPSTGGNSWELFSNNANWATGS